MSESTPPPSLLGRIVRFSLENKLVVVLATVFVMVWGTLVAPFDWQVGGLPRSPVPIDAIPDIGENQQIVFTQWMGRSPQDVEDQITYPLTVSLLGVPGVRTIRSYSFFGFSSIYIIFNEDIDFYWSRSRVLEKLASLPAGTMPEDVRPALGPDATSLGQVFWYTLEGRDAQGRPAPGWDLDELRSVQDWHVRYALLSASGVSEVGSVGGFVREYQVDVDPDAMRAFGVSIAEVADAVRMANLDVGARNLEINGVEYFIRGRGFIRSLEDIENSVIKSNENVPVYVKDVAVVTTGPALRRGALNKGGAEAVGGVVVARFGDNPLAVIQNIKAKIEEIAPGLPKKTLADGRVSQVTVVPFYDRSGLIYETLGTLRRALTEEVLVTIIVVAVMVFHLQSSLLIAGLLPLAILMTFIAMRYAGVDANIVALSGIAIAIGTMVDVGIVICENILRHLERLRPGEDRLEAVYKATTEVGSAVLTAVATTVVSFLPVFTMQGAEGKLFTPLAFTKTFALVASIIVALTVIPAFAHLLFTRIGGVSRRRSWLRAVVNGIAVLAVSAVLSSHWVPLGPEFGAVRNYLFVVLLIGSVLGGLLIFQYFYEPLLRFCLVHKGAFLSFASAITAAGLMVWLGFAQVFFFVPELVRTSRVYAAVERTFPGLGREFMQPLDEGSFLHMPSTMPHASIGEAMDILQRQVMALNAIPEIETAVGKLGRAESPLDPAPISMFETIINYKTEYISDRDGYRLPFRFDDARGEFARTADGELIPDDDGRPFRQWRDEVRSPDDIWDEIARVTRIPGTTNAPKLQPIAARIVMLQSGMRAPMGVKIKGPDLETLDRVGLEVERLLKQVPGIQAGTVIADRIVGKPYLEIEIDRAAIARYGVHLNKVQDVIEVAIGGKRLTTTVEGRERYPVRVRYQRELRDRVDSLGRILVPSSSGGQIPLEQLAKIRYLAGPQVIKSEDTFLVAYVVFDKVADSAEVDVVEEAQAFLNAKIASGEFEIPPGVSFTFAGSYENQIRAQKTLALILPLALFVIFLILYFQFKQISTTLLVFSGILVAWSGGFLMLWLYGQSWFLDFSLLGVNLRELFAVAPYNLSVAVWVGFLALFGIASDNGVILATYLRQTFAADQPRTIAAIRDATVKASLRRIRPCLMTSATTILALVPVLTSTGRGADVMVPMAIPSFGGMVLVIITVFVVPVLYSAIEERRIG
ncbi:MAG: efflux RND transporter permease subunit [Deltaproteobacteria bacterium]